MVYQKMHYYERSVCRLMQMLHSDMCLWHFECSVTFLKEIFGNCV